MAVSGQSIFLTDMIFKSPQKKKKICWGKKDNRFQNCYTEVLGNKWSFQSLNEDMHCKVVRNKFVFCLKWIQEGMPEIAVMASNALALMPLKQFNARIFPLSQWAGCDLWACFGAQWLPRGRAHSGPAIRFGVAACKGSWVGRNWPSSSYFASCHSCVKI